MSSKIEKLICNSNFSYLQPYFYNYNLALCCELEADSDDKAEYYAAVRKKPMRFTIFFFQKEQMQ